MGTHRIYLIPGFFGFANIGGLTYFHHVSGLIEAEMAARGLSCQVIPVRTHPTASIPRRAVRLAEVIEGTTGYDDDPVHLIGHSTGGLDARLLTSPGVQLPTSIDLGRLVERIDTVVTVAAPHFGTPMAAFFSHIMGQRLLALLTLLTIHSTRFGKAPLSVMRRLGGLFARADDLIGLDNTVLDQVYASLLDDFTLDRQKAITDFLDELRSDQSLIPQLTPEGIDLFNAGTRDAPGVRYASVVTRARRPGVRSFFHVGLDPYAQVTHVIFRTLHLLARGQRTPGPDVLTLARTQQLRHVYGETPDGDASDGVVPTLSQLWGEVIHVTRADHLDVVGHFHDPRHSPPHVDWLATGSHFDRAHFEALWKDVVAFMTRTGV